jgi:tetratricopeptide (TPR) repeat protein
MNQESIERFLAKDMTPEELKEFESKMANDPELYQEVKKYEETINALKVYDRSALKTRLKDRDLRRLGDNTLGRSNKWIWVIIGFVLIFFSILWYLNTNHSNKVSPLKEKDSLNGDSVATSEQTLKAMDTTQSNQGKSSSDSIQQKKIQHQSPDELFAMHFEPYTDELLQSAVRGEDSEMTPFEHFQSLYSTKKYAEAIKAFELLDPAMKSNDNVLFLKANALMATDKIGLASILLDKIIRKKNSRYLPEVYWYMALCELKKGKFEKAKFYLQNPLLRNRNESKKLLEKL